MGILSIDLNNTNYDEDDLETIIYASLLAWHIKFENCRAFKKELN